MKNPPRFILLDDDLFALTIAANIIRSCSRRAEIISFCACKDAIDYMEADCFTKQCPETVI